MSIGKIIKTGLAIYGGAVLAKKLGQYIFVKNKDKIAAKVKEKIVKACDKAIDEVFKEPEKKPYKFKASEITFHTADDAYDIRQRMIDTIHEYGQAMVGDYKDLAAICPNYPEDYKWGWTDPDIFEAASVERKIWGSTYMYYLEVQHPDRLEGK